jgi:heme oxygenase
MARTVGTACGLGLPMTSFAAPHRPLLERLKSGTADLHRRVERSAFMSGLLRGQIERPSYLALLHNLRAVYATLEAALQRQAAEPALAPVVMPELFRCRALDQDIQFLAATQLRDMPALRPATLHYVERLVQLERSAPTLLLAHAYVRYLGDLNGGQALRRVVARGLGLQGNAGTMFYDFGEDAARRQLMHRFREGLAAIEVQTPDVDALVMEAVSAFERHEALFDQLWAARRRC